MASGAHHCKDCSLYFDSAQSLEVHLQYHKENLMSMWMNSEDKSREEGNIIHSSLPPRTSAPTDLPRIKSERDDTTGVGCSSTPINPIYIKEEQSSYIKEEPSGFIKEEPVPHTYMGGGPLSPMDYDLKFSPGMTSPKSNLVSQGPASGSNSSVGFPQQSPSFYSQEYSQMLQPQQNQYGAYQPNYNYDDYYFRGGSGVASRFHPYMGRSPIPTPSPSASLSDMKDEPNSNPHTPEILDLDSQEVLNTGTQANMSSIPMWRPHEQYPSSKNMSNGNCPSATPVGMGASVPGIPPNHGVGGLGPSGLVPSSLGPMMPPMQSVPYSGHSLSTPAAPSIQPAIRPNTSSYYSQGLSGSSVINTSNTTNFTPTTPAAQSPHEPAPSSEYPANVKRAKSFKCEDCNKWFTSHGHLKRHYNTTLHKNMTKNNNQTPSSTQPATPDITHPPIISPSAKSIGEASTTSSHDEESNISSSDIAENTNPAFQSTETTNPAFQSTASAFQPPVNPTRFDMGSNIYHGPLPGSIGNHLNAVIPPQSQHFLGNTPIQHQHHHHQPPPPSAPTMYHGHFSTNPTYPQQPPHPSLGHNPFFPVANNFGYPQQGGQQGPGLHSMNEFPGPNPNELFSSFRLESSERAVPQSVSSTGDSNSAASPDVASPDTSSEASMDSNESESNYKCNDCSKTFNRMCYLTQHRTTYHEGEKPFKCGTCGKRFPTESTFTEHQGKHAGEKPYKCEVCPKQFNHKTDLRRHMCLHTGEKPFTCEICNKGFIRKDHMLKHYQTHKKKALASSTPQPTTTTHHHPSMLQNAPPTLNGHHVFPSTHPMAHVAHASGGHPHVVAPPVY